MDGGCDIYLGQGCTSGFRGRGRGRGPLGVARGRGLLSGTPSRGRGCSGLALSPAPPGSGSGFPDPEVAPCHHHKLHSRAVMLFSWEFHRGTFYLFTKAVNITTSGL